MRTVVLTWRSRLFSAILSCRSRVLIPVVLGSRSIVFPVVLGWRSRLLPVVLGWGSQAFPVEHVLSWNDLSMLGTLFVIFLLLSRINRYKAKDSAPS